MLHSGADNELTFNLELTGSTVAPTVRVVLYVVPTLMFSAKHVENNVWAVNIRLPEVASGSYKIEIETIIGNRLFVPLSEQIDVQNVRLNASFTASDTGVSASFHESHAPVASTFTREKQNPVPEQERASEQKPEQETDPEDTEKVIESTDEPAIQAQAPVEKVQETRAPQRGSLVREVNAELDRVKRLRQLAGIRT